MRKNFSKVLLSTTHNFSKYLTSFLQLCFASLKQKIKNSPELSGVDVGVLPAACSVSCSPSNARTRMLSPLWSSTNSPTAPASSPPVWIRMWPFPLSLPLSKKIGVPPPSRFRDCRMTPSPTSFCWMNTWKNELLVSSWRVQNSYGKNSSSPCNILSLSIIASIKKTQHKNGYLATVVPTVAVSQSNRYRGAGTLPLRDRSE